MQIGHVLKKLFDDGVVKREDLWITSKLWFMILISKPFSSIYILKLLIQNKNFIGKFEVICFIPFFSKVFHFETQ